MSGRQDEIFDIRGKCVAITGGAGVLCSETAKHLARRGAKIVVVDYDSLRANEVCKEIESEGGFAVPVECDVLNKHQIEEAFTCAVQSMGKVDVLINGAGGNKPEATSAPPAEFFDLPADAIRYVFDLNCLGTILASQVFGKHMANRGQGVIINMSSMNAFRPLTNIAAYSAAKAAVTNFTQWLAVYMAQRHSPSIRVNAIAPGFFVTKQNRFLLFDEKAEGLTPRGRQILDHTPQGRFGEPEDLIGTLIWLISDAAKFVTGIVVGVDGGFGAYSGV
ncbi:MAG: SDR family oxidoreductase [Planctomycetota bacterium]|jgi:NAD(P)-dependent dehydrogenase (short-subunit alcohol dehydrogenase family)